MGRVYSEGLLAAYKRGITSLAAMESREVRLAKRYRYSVLQLVYEKGLVRSNYRHVTTCM